MTGSSSALVLKYTPLGIVVSLVAGAVLQSAGLADVDWGTLIDKVPEVAMVLVVVFYSLSMNQQNRDFIEKMESRHAQAMERIATEIQLLGKVITQHDARMEQFIRDGSMRR